MPEVHPALAIEISVTAACRLFPGTPAWIFWWAGRSSGSGVSLSFGEALRAASAYWQPKAKAAQSSRFSVQHRKAWAARKATAAEAVLIILRAAIDAEISAAPSGEPSLADVAKLAG